MNIFATLSRKSTRGIVQKDRIIATVFIFVFAVGGAVLLFSVYAATPYVSFEAEQGATSSSAAIIDDTTASGGEGVQFGVSPAGSGGTVVNVSTATQLTTALSAAQPGEVITLADGTYSGNFNSTASGTAAAPITLVGSRNAILDGGSLSSGYTFSLGTKDSSTTINYWRLDGFTITGGQKGIVVDNLQNSIIDNVYVHEIGDEGIHLRDNSSNDTVENSTITKTGQGDQSYGEGIYVGSAVSNWSTYSQGVADHSNDNKLLDNNISYTGAENMDIKEGTHSGTISGNTFDGEGMCWDTTADCNDADSMIDMKGAGWTVANNNFTYEHAIWTNNKQTDDGIQDHVISGTGDEESGDNNTFSNNNITDVAGYGFNIEKSATGVIVNCNNTVTDAGDGFANVTCIP